MVPLPRSRTAVLRLALMAGWVVVALSCSKATRLTGVDVTSITVSPGYSMIAVGGTTQLQATARDAHGRQVDGVTFTWSSNATQDATVNGSGQVTGDGVGTAVITASTEGLSGSASVDVVSATGTFTLVGAGDIADGSTRAEETAKLLDQIPGTVFTAGDNAYPDGSASDYQRHYEPTWGRHKARTRPAPGNHEYHQAHAQPYHDYFGGNAGPDTLGYYSYNLGDWHIISLNSNVNMRTGSPQEKWLRADLAASSSQCTIAIWHHPRFSSGTHGSSTKSLPIWKDLYQAGAEIIIVGHDHNYQRFAPMTPDGGLDPARGIREFVVGTGGARETHFPRAAIANTESYNTNTNGVLKLTLGPGRYSWQFVPVAGKTFTDTGSGTCHR